MDSFFIWKGYGGADEAKMLLRHLEGTSAKIGVGANRAATATCFIEKYGCVYPHSIKFFDRLRSHQNAESHLDSEKIGVAILDDGMQVNIFYFFLFPFFLYILYL